jgi:hypothetical protein
MDDPAQEQIIAAGRGITLESNPYATKCGTISRTVISKARATFAPTNVLGTSVSYVSRNQSGRLTNERLLFARWRCPPRKAQRSSALAI